MTSACIDNVKRYVDLITDYLDRRLEPQLFADRYVRAYLEDDTGWSDDIGDALESLFGAAEALDEDPDYRQGHPWAASPEELRERAVTTVRNLRAALLRAQQAS